VGIIKQRIVRTTQPQYPVGIDRNNPDANGVTSFLYPVGSGLHDACGLLKGANTDIASGVFPGGRILEFNGTSSSVNFGDVESVNFAGAYSICILFRPDAMGGTRREMLLGKDKDTGRQFTIEINPNGTDNTGNGDVGSFGHTRFVSGSTYYQKYSAASVLENGKYYWLVIGSTDGSSDIVAYLNGEPITLYAGSGSTTGLMQNTTTSLYAGRRDYPGFADYFDGAIGAISIINQAPSLKIANKFYRETYSLLLPQSRNIYLPSAGGAATHATSGTLTGQASSIAGTSAHIAKHATSGALTGQGSTIAGTATRYRQHATSGALTGAGSSVAGVSVHNIPHATSGALAGSGASVSGSADHAVEGAHATSGALTGPGAAVSGAAARLTAHAASGILIGGGAALAGTAAVVRMHATTGALIGPGAALVAAASNDSNSVVLDPYRTLTIPLETRVLTIARETRTLTVQ